MKLCDALFSGSRQIRSPPSKIPSFSDNAKQGIGMIFAASTAGYSQEQDQLRMDC
jgi:hypothetical protein